MKEIIIYNTLQKNYKTEVDENLHNALTDIKVTWDVLQKAMGINDIEDKNNTIVDWVLHGIQPPVVKDFLMEMINYNSAIELEKFLNSKTKLVLSSICKELKISGISNKNRDYLIKTILLNQFPEEILEPQINWKNSLNPKVTSQKTKKNK